MRTESLLRAGAWGRWSPIDGVAQDPLVVECQPVNLVERHPLGSLGVVAGLRSGR